VDCRTFVPRAPQTASMDGKSITNRHSCPTQGLPEEIWGIEDPRITFVPELQQYVVTYTSYSRGGPGGVSGSDQKTFAASSATA